MIELLESLQKNCCILKSEMD